MSPRALSAVIVATAQLLPTCFSGSTAPTPSSTSATNPASQPATAATANPERPIPYPIPESKAFARAVERGTRTRTGEPGPRYWQQYARYTIDAELQPSTNQVSAHGTIRYFNRSPDTLA